MAGDEGLGFVTGPRASETTEGHSVGLARILPNQTGLVWASQQQTSGCKRLATTSHVDEPTSTGYQSQRPMPGAGRETPVWAAVDDMSDGEDLVGRLLSQWRD
jgi:hypothetical protein